MSRYPFPFLKLKALLASIGFSSCGSLALTAQEITSFSLTPEAGGLRARLEGTWEPGGNYIIEDSPDMVTWNRISPVMRPALTSLNWNHLQYRWGGAGSFIAGTSLASRDRRWFYRVRKLPPADSSPQVFPTTPMGRLSQNGTNGPLSYRTQSNWNVRIDLSTITVTDPTGKVSYEHWGHPHENLNGKHLKDWFSTHRTMLLPGGAMITLKANGPQGVVEAVSIYDVDQTHKLNTTNNTVTLSVPLVRVGEAAEPDGETMRLWHIGRGCFYAENIYTEATSGNGTAVPQVEVPLGTTGGDANPSQVNDLVDDPRLAHT